MADPDTSRQRWFIVGSIFLVCFALTIAAAYTLRRWRDRPPRRPQDAQPVTTTSASGGEIRPGIEDVPARLDVPSGVVLARKEWDALREAFAREGFDEVRFSLTKFKRIGLDAAPVLVPVLRNSVEEADRLLAFAALAHAVPAATDESLEQMVLSAAADEVIADPGRALASAALVDADRGRKVVALLALGSPSLPWGIDLLARFIETSGTSEETELLLLAVRSASQTGGAEATRLLVSLLAKPLPPDVKEEVASMLAEDDSPGLGAELERMLVSAQTPEDKVLLAAILTRVAMREGATVRLTEKMKEELRPVLTAALLARGSGDGLKAQALHALGGLDDEGSLTAIVEAMKSLVTPDLVQIAGEELGRHGGRAHGFMLVESFKGERYNVNEIHRLAAALEIADRTRANDLRGRVIEAGLPYLRRLLLETPHGSLKQQALRVVVSMGPQTANPILWDVAANGNEKQSDVRLRALRYLQETGGPPEAHALEQLAAREQDQKLKDGIQKAIEGILARGK